MPSIPERSMYSVFNISKVFHILDLAVKNGFLNPNNIFKYNTNDGKQIIDDGLLITSNFAQTYDLKVNGLFKGRIRENC